MNVGQRITELREAKKISVNKLANLSGVSQSYLRDIELGNKQPTVQYLEYICAGLGTTIQKFFSEEEKKAPACEKCLMNQLTAHQQQELQRFIRAMMEKPEKDKEASRKPVV